MFLADGLRASRFSIVSVYVAASAAAAAAAAGCVVSAALVSLLLVAAVGSVLSVLKLRLYGSDKWMWASTASLASEAGFW